MFAYCGNNPICFTDPSGFARKWIHFCLDDGFQYITDQTASPWGDMQFGCSTVGKMGYGLIAIYNAMISLGDPRLFSDIYDYFDSFPLGLIDHGQNGLFVGFVAMYFMAEGYDIAIVSSLNNDRFLFHSQRADACIILYQRGSLSHSSGHYVEYNRHNDYYIGRNTAEANGVHLFDSPIEYGSKTDRYAFVGVFVYKPGQ